MSINYPPLYAIIQSLEDRVAVLEYLLENGSTGESTDVFEKQVEKIVADAETVQTSNTATAAKIAQVETTIGD